ncbi:MAG TPA: hypothetical protein VN950_19255 [Terriglobales bacterium]|nr:hypothetical protein [Terriglobales bacterium]
MKRRAATDAKRSAANDKPENGKGKSENAKATTSLRTVPPNPSVTRSPQLKRSDAGVPKGVLRLH